MRKTINFKRVVSFVLMLCMVLGMVNIMPVANAASSGEQMLYMKPNSNWTQASARFAAYFFGNGEKWVDMKDSDGNGVYEVAVPAGFTKVIFCRMNPSAAANNWNNKWNQTGDLTVSGNVSKCFTVPSGAWDGSTTGWSTYGKSYTVTFDMNGHGEQIETMTVPEGGKGIAPTAPTAEGFAFGGWYTTAECTTEYKFNSVITKNITVYAKWVEVKKEFTVTFDLGGHGDNITETVAEGIKVAAPTAPTADGYLFRGWYTDEECTAAYDFDTPVMADITLYAKWLKIEDVTVSLHFKDVSAWGAVRVYIWGTDIAAANSWPGTVLSDSDSDGWYDATITAKIGQTVNFLFNNGGSDTNEKKTADLTTGELLGPVELWVQGNEIFAEKPALIVPKYYIAGFDGNWAPDAYLMTYNEESHLYEIVFTDVAAGEQKFKVTDGTWNNAWGGGPNPDGDGNYVITVPKQGDVTITFNAATKEITVDTVAYPVVTFDMNGHGDAIASQTITEGGKATEPTAPTAGGYAFGGWYTNAECSGEPYNFDAEVTADITLYAKWTEKIYYVAGNIAEKFPDADHRMTYNADGGYYEKTYFLAPTGRYEIEIVDGDNNTCSRSAATITLTKIADITVKFHEGSGDIDCDITYCCSVNFEMNGHGEAVETQIISSGGKATEPTAPTAEGFIFGGWYTNAECSGEPYNFDTEVTASIRLYARWIEEEVVTYTVTFDMNGHGDTIADQIITEGEKAVAPAAPAAEGYTFGGWYTEAECENAYNFDTVLTDDIILYAKWTVNQYTITFVTGDGVDPVDPITADYGTAIEAPADPTREGFTFGGWYTDAECTAVYDFETVVTADITLYAKWTEIVPEPEPEELVIYLKPNGNWQQANAWFAAYFFGKDPVTWVPMTDSDNDSVYEVTVPAGYTKVIFCRMNPAAQTLDWSNKWNQTGNLIVPTGSKVCYTVPEGAWDNGNGSWGEYTPPAEPVEVTYIIAGSGSIFGGDWNPGNTANQMILNEDTGLYEKTYTNAPAGSYAFKVTDGTWNKSWGGSGADGNYEFALTKTADITIKFDAATKTISLEIVSHPVVTFEMNGHGTAIEAQTVVPGGKATEPADPSAEGYTFGGWYSDAELTVSFDFNAEITADATVYAKWTVNQYTITFITGEGATEIAPITADYGTAIEAPADPTREGFKFGGWDKEIPATMPAEDLTITATWYENNGVIFNMNGHGDAIAPQSIADGEKATKPEDPTAEGYTFGGWYTDAACTEVYDFDTKVTADITLYAKWTVNQYTITFVTGEGATEIAPITADYGTAIVAPADPTREGYKFTGWDVEIPATMPAGDLTVTAQWKEVCVVNIHYYNENLWGTVYGYVWTEDETLLMGAWPGTALIDEDGDGWHDLTVITEEPQAFKFILNNGSGGTGNQTADLATGAVTGSVELWVVGNDKTVYTEKPEVKEPEPLEYYLIGWINGADYSSDGYHFVDGKVTATFKETSYVHVKDSKGNKYWADAYCEDVSVVLKKAGYAKEEKMLAPGGVELEYTLVVNNDGTVTLSYSAVSNLPEIPEDANTVTIHFLKPTTWGGIVNAYLWRTDAEEEEKILGAWPGKTIPANERAGWFDLTVAADKAFNFIFNDGGSNQNSQLGLSTGEITGPTELWVVGETVYTTAPREWTHYTVTVHYRNSNNWSSVHTYAWVDGNVAIMGTWPGTPASASVNSGWYNAVIHVEIGKELEVVFNNNSGSQTGDINLGVMTGNAEIWLDGTGNQVARPAGWVDEARTIHLPGTIGGNGWNAAGNRMTYDPARGLYTITFENVTPGTYAYKIAVNGNWKENYGANGEAAGADMSVTVTEAQDVTFWYSDSSHRVVCSVNYDIDAVVALTGTGIAEGTRLTDPELDGLYTVTLNLPAGTYRGLKITCGDVEVEFADFTISAGKNITFNFDPSSGMGYHNGSNVKVNTDHIYYNTKDLDYKDPFGAVPVGTDVKFSITTGTDATGVALVINGIGSIALHKDGEAVDGVQRWTGTYAFESIGQYKYYFAITNGSDMVFYCDDNWNNYYKTGDYGTGGIGNPNDIFAYDIIVHTADFKTPDWMKDAVIYQIFPDRFFDAIEANNDDQTTARGTVDYEYVTDWYMLPENPEMVEKHPDDYPIYALKGDGEWSNEIYGGDLKGVTERIEYLKALGVNVIYFNPVFSSISNHRYDACDYMEIDPILGTLGDFEELVAVAEANGMHIILDGVFNHVSDDSVYFDRYYKFLPLAAEKYDGKIGAYPYWAYVYDLMNEQGYSKAAAEDSAKAYFSENYGITDWSYTEWFHVNNEKATYSDKIGLRAGKKVYTYEGWWGYDSMPVIKSTNGSEFQTGNWAEEMLSHENPNSVNSYWISKGMDGWRLDVANEVSDETWQHFRDSVKALDSEAVIIGEIWADATHYLMGDMYDSVMNYIFRDAVAGFARGYLINRDNKAEKWDTDYTADDALTTLEILRERYPQEAFYAMMNLVASHDTARILSYLDDVEDDRYQKDLANNFPLYETTSDRAKQLQYVVAFIQFTYAGAPTIYYGDEIGMTGCDDPDDRRAFTWGMGQQDLVEWYAQMAAIRAEYPALRTGSVEPIYGLGNDIMGYIRSDENNTLTVLANRSYTAKTIVLEGKWVDLVSGETFSNTVTVPAYRGVILVDEDEVKEYSVNYEALAPAYDPAYIVAERSKTPPADSEPLPETYTVSFDLNGHGAAIDAQAVTEGEKAAEPAAPTAEGYEFGGWYTDAACTEAYDFDAVVSADITLYAKWTREAVRYTVRFNLNGHGSAISSQSVIEGNSAHEPAAPTAEGWEFGGWYTDAACTNAYGFGAVNGSITLYAKWTEITDEPADTDEPQVDYTEVYEDLEQDIWYYESVDYVIDKGLMKGTGDSTFAPTETFSRAMMWTVLARLDGSEVESAEGNWYDKSQKWAVDAGISDGGKPNSGVTREELIVMLWRYMGKPESTGNLDKYTDAASVSSWAEQAMTWAVEIGLVSGVSADTLDPTGSATRAQVAVLIQRFCDLTEQG